MFVLLAFMDMPTVIVKCAHIYWVSQYD